MDNMQDMVTREKLTNKDIEKLTKLDFIEWKVDCMSARLQEMHKMLEDLVCDKR